MYSNQERYQFVPADNLGSPSLSVNRATGEIQLSRHDSVPNNARRSNHKIYGILGLISLALGDYIVVITNRDSQGKLIGNHVYQATAFAILPLNPDINVQSPPHPVEAHLLKLLRAHLDSGIFLFSYEYDVTRRMQVQWQHHNRDADKGMWEVADDRFFWNKYLQSRLTEHAATVDRELSHYILPVIYGTFDARPAFLHGRHIQIALISRRSRYRAGTRYFRRGIDQDGHVANFNETEQLVFVENPQQKQVSDVPSYSHQFSFVQIRGSIPLFWAEVNTLRYVPDLQIMDLPITDLALRTHLEEQVRLYGSQHIVNLVNHIGHEKPIKEAYERHVAQAKVPHVAYDYFDFHTECKRMRYDRVSLLIDRIGADLEGKGYFQLNRGDDRPMKVQTGVVRTNCMDNLDRTNVIQGALAKWTLNRQLQAVGILPPNASIDDYESTSKDFRELWADHADLIAQAYAGSGALKSDFTRTNKRTRQGALEDGVKSTLRYLKNNYFDGARQDAFDLFTGAWVADHQSLSSAIITDTRPLVLRSMPAVAVFSLFMICAGLTLPRTSDYSLLYYFVLWSTFLALSLVFVYLHGIDYVSWPRLLPLTDIIHYDGPGFREAHHGKGFGGPKSKAKSVNRWQPNHSDLSIHGEEIEMGHRKRVD